MLLHESCRRGQDGVASVVTLRPFPRHHAMLRIALVVAAISCLSSANAQSGGPSGDGMLTVCTKDSRPMSQCSIRSGSEVYTGYDVEVFRGVAALLDLEEGVDFQFRCISLGEILDSLVADNGTCSMATGGITISTEREALGLQFSYPTYASSLGILVPATPEESDGWFFIKPFHWSVWLAIGVSLALFPVLAYIVEALSLKGRIKHEEWRPGLRNAYWEMGWLVMQNGASSAQSSSARIMLLAYGALAVVLLSIYQSNLTAFLTISNISTQVRSIAELRGRAVGTTEIYRQRLVRSAIVPSVYPSQKFPDLVTGGPDDWVTALRTGSLAAFVYDEPLLRYIDSQTECDLRMLDTTFEPFDYGMVFPSSTNRTFVDRVDAAILKLQEQGVLEDLRAKFIQIENFRCKLVGEGTSEDVLSITFTQLWGIWVLLAGCVALGLLVLAVVFPRRKRKLMRQASFRRDIPGLPSTRWDQVSDLKHAPSLNGALPPSPTHGRFTHSSSDKARGTNGAPGGGSTHSQGAQLEEALEQVHHLLGYLQTLAHMERAAGCPSTPDSNN